MNLESQSLPGEHVVLVHGTWGHGVWRSWFWNFIPDDKRARDIEWPVSHELKAQGCKVHSFTWSGNNTHAAREAAGEELANFISTKVPANEPLSLIAHSHGGAVVGYALPKLSGARIRSLIFLATPFLHFRPQKLDTSGFMLLPAAFAYAFACLGIGLLLYFYFEVIHQQPRAGETTWLLVGSILAFALTFAYAGYRLAKRVVTPFVTLSDRLAGLCKEHQPSAPPPGETLILRNIADEAQGAITAGGALEWLFGALWGALSWMVGLPKRLLAAIKRVNRDHAVGMAAFWLGAIVVLAMLMHFFEDTLTSLWAFGLAATALAILVVCTAQAALMLLILALNFLRFGLARDFIGTAFLQVVAEPAPVGAWQVEVFPGGGFAHSEIHQNPEVAARIVARIRQHC